MDDEQNESIRIIRPKRFRQNRYNSDDVHRKQRRIVPVPHHEWIGRLAFDNGRQTMPQWSQDDIRGYDES